MLSFQWIQSLLLLLQDNSKSKFHSYCHPDNHANMITRCRSHLSPDPNSTFLFPFGWANSPEELIAGWLGMNIWVTYIPPLQDFLSTITHGNRSLRRLLSQTSKVEDFLAPLLLSLPERSVIIPQSPVLIYSTFCWAEELIRRIDWDLEILSNVRIFPSEVLCHCISLF